MHQIQISYNEEFDKEHYPINEKHHVFLDSVYKTLSIDRSVEARYFVTLHGVIFRIPANQIKRFHRETLKELLEISEFRWIESNSDVFEVAMTHI